MTEYKKNRLEIFVNTLWFMTSILLKSIQFSIMAILIILLMEYDFNSQEVFTYLSTIDTKEINHIFMITSGVSFFLIGAFRYLLKGGNYD